MPVQLGLNLPARTALERDDFLIAPSNAVALAMIDAWRDWPQSKLVLIGAHGAGKTHLAHVWASDSGAKILAASDLSDADIEVLAKTPVVVEDVDLVHDNMGVQTALFHLHNLMQAAECPLLLTGTPPPRHWRMSLPDLQSRIDAAGHATLDDPDDTLLAAVIAKHFTDRQLTPRPDVIPFLVTRMERSFAAARDIVSQMDALSLARKKPVTRALASEVLDKHGRAEG